MSKRKETLQSLDYILRGFFSFRKTIKYSIDDYRMENNINCTHVDNIEEEILETIDEEFLELLRFISQRVENE